MNSIQDLHSLVPYLSTVLAYPMLGEHLNFGASIVGALDRSDEAFILGPAPENDKRNAGSRFAENVSIVLRPSSSSHRLTEKIDGLCRSVSQSGCGVIASFPPRVGDIYRIEVSSQTSHSLHGVHARCVRCHLVDEEAFDSGFCFLSPVDLRHEASHAPRTHDPLA